MFVNIIQYLLIVYLHCSVLFCSVLDGNMFATASAQLKVFSSNNKKIQKFTGHPVSTIFYYFPFSLMFILSYCITLSVDFFITICVT